MGDNAGGCFGGGTLVATPDGPRLIEELRAGDAVIAYDHASGRWSPRTVTAVHDNNYEDTLVTVSTDGGAFRATVHHPVWVLAGRELEERPTPHELSAAACRCVATRCRTDRPPAAGGAA